MNDEGAIIIEEGAGGGAGGGNEEVVEETIDEGAGEGDEGGSEENAGDDSEGARPTDIRKVLRTLATNQELGLPKNFEKDVTGALFTRNKVNELGGLRGITDTLDRLETHGGIEAIEQMAEELEASKNLENGLERGDPEVLASWAKDFPDGFRRSVLPMLDTLGKIDEERAEQVEGHIFTRFAEKFGVLSTLAELGQALTADKKEDAVRLFNKLAQFTKDARAIGAKAKTDHASGRSAELDQREKDLNERDLKNFKASVRSEVNSKVSAQINKELRAYLLKNKVFKVPANVANRLRQGINSELQRLVNGDSEYQRRYEQLVNGRDRQRFADYVIKKAFGQIGKAIKAVAPDFNLKAQSRPGSGGPRRSAAAAGASASRNDGPRTVSGVPKTLDVDFTRTDKSTFLATKRSHGQAWLRDGSLAKW